jgi:ABC-type transport system substrate-binding protein
VRTRCSRGARLLAALAACVLAAGASSCGADGKAVRVSEPAPVPGGVLRYPLSSDPQSITPIHASTSDELTVVRALYAGLVDADAANGGLAPVVARTWHAGPGLRTFTFLLRPGLRFADGTPLTANTFVQDWNIVCRAGGTAAKLLTSVEGGDGCGTDTWLGPLTGVRAPEADRLEVRLRFAFAGFPAVLANPGTWAFPPQLAQTDAEIQAMDAGPVGAGPFRLASRSASALTLERNPAAVQPAHLDGVTLDVMPPSDADRAAMAAYRGGRLDVADVPPQQAQVTMADPVLSRQLLVRPVAAVTVVLLQPSARLGPAQRRAIAWATDAPAVASSVTGGVSTVADGLVPAVTPEYLPGVSPYAHDPAVARRLAPAGSFPRDVPLAAFPDRGLPGLATPERVAETLVEGYRRAGLPVRRGRCCVAPALVARVVAAYPSADGILSQLVAEDDLGSLAPARSTADPARRAQRYAALARRILDEATVIPVTFDARALVVSPRVHHFQIDSLGLPHFESCWLTGGRPASS